MKRPYIICHILSALEGKIAGRSFGTPQAQAVSEEYARMPRQYLHGQLFFLKVAGGVSSEKSGAAERGRNPAALYSRQIRIERRCGMGKRMLTLSLTAVMGCAVILAAVQREEQKICTILPAL